MPDDTTKPDARGPGTPRRTVLRGVAAAGAIGAATPLLAACGGGGDSSGSPDAGGSTTTAGTPPSGGGGTKLTTTSAIPVGEGTVFSDEKVVVTQPKAGEFKAFTAVCTHMGCIVADVSGGTINCNCHGSKYDISTGQVVNPPAPKPLAPVKITVKGKEIDLA